MAYSIFEYKEFASCNFLGGNTDSFEIKVGNDGIIEYQKNNFNDERLELAYYKLKLDLVKKIEEIIESNAEIFNVNSHLDNGSLDGCGNEFWFAYKNRNRKILAWNIDLSIDDGHKIRKEYLKKYGENLKQERLVLKVFFEICNILKEEGYKLDLYNFNTSNSKLYT